MRRLFLVVTLMCNILWGFARDESTQVLIFRNTGEVNLLYSEKLDSIVFSKMAPDSVWHDSIVSQIFYSVDTALVVPIAEIDSVAFGPRNIIELKKNVINLKENQFIDYVVRYDGEYVYFREDLPQSLMPKEGEYLLFADKHEIFPFGLCAEVLQVAFENGEYAVQVKNIPFEEVFDNFFYAGTVTPSESTTAYVKGKCVQPRGETVATGRVPVPINDNCSMVIDGNLTWDLQCVVKLGYYHVAGSIDADFGFTTDLSLNGEIKYESEPFLRIPLPPVAMVLRPEFTVSAFADFNAEMGFEYDMRRKWHHEFSWTRKKGQNSFTSEQNNASASDEHDEAKVDLYCNGSFYFGPKVALDLGVLFDVVGVGVDMKFGPEFTGEFGLGVLRETLDTFDPKAYGKAQLEVCSRIGFDGYITYQKLFDDKETKEVLCSLNHSFGKHTLHLFPEFQETKAVLDRTADQPLSVSTKMETPIVYPLEVGFEVLDENEQVLDSVFLEEPILANDSSQQGFSVVLDTEIPEGKEKQLSVRPVFHYRGYTVRADKKPLLSDLLFQPYISYQSNGAVSCISGLPFIGYYKEGELAYSVGNYVPVVRRDSVFSDKNEGNGIVSGVYVDDIDMLLGLWSGDWEQEQVQIEFSDQNTGVYRNLTEGNEKTFSYRVNEPQTGCLALCYENGDVQVLTITFISSERIDVVMDNQKKYSLFKK